MSTKMFGVKAGVQVGRVPVGLGQRFIGQDTKGKAFLVRSARHKRRQESQLVVSMDIAWKREKASFG